MGTQTEREGGVRADAPPGTLALPRAPNDVVFFTVSVAGSIAVPVDRVGDSGALLIGAMFLVLTAICILSRNFVTVAGQRSQRVRASPADYRAAGSAAPSSSASSDDSP
jgi:hypothetical protein